MEQSVLSKYENDGIHVISQQVEHHFFVYRAYVQFTAGDHLVRLCKFQTSDSDSELQAVQKLVMLIHTREAIMEIVNHVGGYMEFEKK